MTTWITDENGNRASVEFWGSEEKARESLATLKNCSDCSDCSYCSYCSNCSDCSRCSGCSNREGDKPEYEAVEIHIPTIPDIDKAVYAAASFDGALDMGNWHTCETTHCRAGWVVHLAGEAGKDLETRFNTELAAMLIYRESGAPINPCRFYDSADDALEDMRKRAGQ